MTQIKPGSKILLLDENVQVEKTPVKVFPYRNENGFYIPGTGHLRHIVVASFGYADDWRAFEAYVPLDMSAEDATEMVASWGDVIYEDRAKVYAELKDIDYTNLRYRY